MNSSVQPSIPILNGKNYYRWCVQMRVLFDYHKLLGVIENRVVDLAENTSKAQQINHFENKKKDRKALYCIHQEVNDEVFDKIVEAKLSKQSLGYPNGVVQGGRQSQKGETSNFKMSI